MVKVVCDCCGQEMTKWFHVVSTPMAKEQWMNIADLLRCEDERDMCEECYNKFLERIVKDG